MNEFRTADLAVACFLATKNQRLKSVEKDPDSTYEKPRGIFVFDDPIRQCDELSLKYRYYQTKADRMVDAKVHFEKIREMKNILYYNLGFLKK